MAANTGIVASLGPDAKGFVTAGRRMGKPRYIAGTIIIPSETEVDSIASLYGIDSKIPWSAIPILGGSVVANEALGTNVTMEIGVARGAPRGGLGTEVDDDVLMASTAVATAGTRTLLDTVAKWPTGKVFRPLWDLAGLSADPGGYADIQFKTAGATTTNAARIIAFSFGFLLTEA